MFFIGLVTLIGISGLIISSLVNKGKYYSEIKEVTENILEGIKYVFSGLRDLFILLIKDSFETNSKLNFNQLKSSLLKLISKEIDNSKTL